MAVKLARRVRHDVLEPTMDARALNIEQDQRIARLDTPEIDSAIERARALRNRPVPGRDGLFVITDQQVDEIVADWWFMSEANGREGRLERQVAGAAEAIGAELYSATRQISHSYRALAPRLRPILRTIGAQLDPDQPDPPANERALAWVAWGTLAKAVPVESFLTRSLANEIGVGPTRTLRHLVNQLTERGRR